MSERERQQLLRWFEAGLDAVDARRCTSGALRGFNGRCAVLALGKAAGGMARGAGDALGERIASALVVAPQAPAFTLPHRWRVLAGEHPAPGEGSLAAGRAIRDWLAGLEPGMPLLVLLSGGGSALAELPVPGLSLAQLRRLNGWLLASGHDIACINAMRARFSRLKRGGLLRLAGARRVSGLCISDVPGDRILDIASGPLCAEPAAWPEVELPDWLRELHARLPLPDCAPPLAPAELRIIARNADALDAIAHAARRDGVSVQETGALHGDAETAGRNLARELRAARPGLHLFGGETTVRLPKRPGSGGRNQQLALAAAIALATAGEVLLLAAGTDGIDGNSGDAGALIDGGTLQRMRDAGLDAASALLAADSNTALAAAGDVVHTGPTGTNVGDVLIAWKR